MMPNLGFVKKVNLNQVIVPPVQEWEESYTNGGVGKGRRQPFL